MKRSDVDFAILIVVCLGLGARDTRGTENKLI